MLHSATGKLVLSAMLAFGLQASTLAESVNPKDDVTVTVNDLVNTLQGPGVSIASPNVVAESNDQIGIFSDYGFLFGSDMSQGVIISTGNIADVVGANTADNTRTLYNQTAVTDPLVGGGTQALFDRVKLSFDVTPDENTLIVEYVFGSEEYNEYVNGGYNDFIRIFVDGNNCAVTANGLIVAIDSINDRANYPPVQGSSGPSSNPFLYINNDPGLNNGESSTATFNTEMDGFTKTVSCRAQVTPGVPVAVDIIMADDGDASLDSWAFFKAQSLRSEPSDEFGDAPDSYQTLAASNGAAHTIVEGVYMGMPPSGDQNGFVDGVDDSAGQARDDSNDDGVLTFPTLDADATTSYSITVNATSINGNDSTIRGWIDFDGDGQFQADEASDAVTVTAGSYETDVTLSWPTIGAGGPDIVMGTSYARIRMVNGTEVLTTGDFAGSKANGEVEDYMLAITGNGDTTPSVVSIDVPPTVTTSIVNSYPVSGDCTAGDNNVTVSISGASPASQSVVCSGGGRWTASFDVSAIADGSNVIVVDASQQDARGNVGNAATAYADKDVTAPTVSIQNVPAATNAGGFTATFVFSEDVVNFALVDIVVGNGTAGNFTAVNASTYTADITPDGNGNVTIDVPANVAQDLNANNNTAAAQASSVYDNTPPVVSITSAPTGNAGNVASYGVSGSCTTGDSDVTVAIAGAAPASQDVTCSGGTWSATFDVSAIGDGVNAIVINASQTDAAGNTGSDSVQADKESDAPSVAIQNAPAIVNSTAPFSVTIQFSEDVTGFAVGDITLINAVAGNFVAVTGSTYTADITPSGTGNISIDVAAGVAQDGAGNDNTAASQVVVLFDNVAPTVSINNAPAIVNNTSAFTVTFAFSEAVSGFDLADIAVGNGAASNFSSIDASTYTADITPSGAGNISIDVAAGVAQDGAGNDNTAATQAVVLFDNVAPTVSINNVPAIVNNTSAFTVTFAFSEAVSGFDLADIAVGNGAASNLSGSGSSYSADITPDGNGDITLDVAASVAQDAAGNGNTAAAQVSVTFDNTAPTVSIDNAPSIVSNTNAFTVNFSFSEPVTGFDLADIAVGNGAASNLSGSGSSYSADITPDGNGDITVDIAANAAQDAAGNGNTAATQVSVTFDNTAPTVSIDNAPAAASSAASFAVNINFSEAVSGFDLADIAVGNGSASNFSGNGSSYSVDITPDGSGDITLDVAANVAQDAAGNGNDVAAQVIVLLDDAAPAVSIQNAPVAVNSTAAFSIDIVFDEAVSGFDLADIAVGNGAASNLSGSGSSYSADITPDGNGDITIDVAANVAQDVAANGNTAASQVVVVYDTVVPAITIGNAPASNNATNTFNVTFTFSEAVSGFDVTDVTVGNGAASNFSGSGSSYSADITPDGNGDITIDVAANVAQDVAGNGNTAAVQVVVTLDASAPVPVIQGAPSSINLTPFTVTIEFAEDVTGFDIGDLVITNATGSNFTVVDASTYTVTVTANGNGDITIDIPAGSASDLNANASLAAQQVVVGFDDTPPVVTIDTPVAANIANQNAYLVSGSCSPGDGAVNVRINVANNPTQLTQSPGCSAGGSYSTSFDVSIYADGAAILLLNASQTDDAGNVGSASDSADKDTVAPAVPVVDSLTSNSVTPTLTGTASVASGETLSVVVNNVSYSEGDGNLSLSGSNWTLQIPAGDALTEGVYDVIATLTDAAGNVSSDGSNNELTVDTTAPAVPSVNSLVTNDTTPTLGGTAVAAAGESLGVTVNGVTYTDGDGNLVLNNGNWTLTIPPANAIVADGQYEVTATLTDAAGNSSSDITSNELEIDTTAPSIPTVNTQTTNNTTPVIDGSADAGSSVTVSVAGATYNTTATPAGSWSIDTATATPDSGSFAPNVNGANEVAVTSADAAGNTATDTTTDELVIDTTAPAVPTVNTLTTNSNTPALTGTASVATGETLSVVVNNVSYSEGDGNLSRSGSDWTLQIPAGGALADGVYAVVATVTDAAGNSSSDATTDELTVDTVIQVPTVNSQTTSNATPVITGSAEAGSDVVIVVAGSTWSTTADNGGNWSIDTSGTPDSGNIALQLGANDVDATSTDAAGNSASDITTGEVVYTEDDDNDGIPNIEECPSGPPFDNSCPDSDGDGIPDFQDTDSDNDGISDSSEAGSDPANPIDTDGDGTPDYRDTDSDNDGTADSSEGTGDSDGDGIPDYVDLPNGNDFDGDGIDDSIECPAYPACADTDADGIPDYADTDSDGDGINDDVEAGTDPANPVDTDGDGTPDYRDTDSDNDGTADSSEGIADADNDGIPDYVDAASGGPGAGDSDGDGIADNIECAMYPLCADSDGDGTPDYMETDSDNDGIGDSVEAGTSGTDSDGDGIDDALDQDNTGGLDLNGDGVDDARPVDTDGDGSPDYLDTDSDGDGIDDATEGLADSDGDGIPDYLDADNSAPGDSDGDGIDDATECPLWPTNCPDSDGDGVPDYMDGNDNDGPLGDIDNDGFANYDDPDSDNDGILDSEEDPNLDGDSNPATGAADTDGDGTPDYLDTDSDGDGIDDATEGVTDSDGDGIPDYLDADDDGPGAGDSDGDGIGDDVECPAWPNCLDTDNDSVPDYMETDSDNDGIPDAFEYGGLASGDAVDTDGDGMPDYRDADSDNSEGDDAGEAGSDPANPVDSDGDGIPDYADPVNGSQPGGGDSDGDGVEDAGECINYPACADSDGDGIPDYNDADSRPYDPDAIIKTGLRGIGANGLPLMLLMLLAVIALRRAPKPLAVLLLAVTGSSQAGDSFQQSWYLGAGVGLSDLTPDTGNTGYALRDGSDTGYKLFAGMDIDERFSIELQQSFLGAAKLDNQGNPLLNPNAEIDYELPGVSVLWYGWHKAGDEDYTYRHGWQAYLMAGLSFIENEANVAYSNENSVQIHFGAGIEYGWHNGIAVRLGADAYDEDATFIYVSALYRFGYGSHKRGSSEAASTQAAATPPAATALSIPEPVVVSYEPVTPAPADRDGDGVTDDKDQCPDTAPGTPVNVSGCVIAELSLKGVNFETNSARITAASRSILDKAAEVLIANPKIRVEVQAHTDDRGRAAYNLKLSEKRAASVRDYLISKGVASERLRAKGYGETQPLADNKTAEGRAKNRRVELKAIQ